VNKLSMVLMALVLGGTIGMVYGAQPLGPAGATLLASADTKEVQSAGAHPNEPGISGDPVSAEKPGKATGGAVQSAGPHPEEPGISGDPVSAEKPGKATGGAVKVVPGADAERNPNPKQ
jgi:hypothetical protein